MSEEAENNTLSGLLDTMTETAQSAPKVSLAKITRTTKKEGFGVLLLAPVVILLLPTGAIPGMPFMCAAFICLVAGQMLIGRSQVWLPKSLKKISFSRKHFIQGIELARPIVNKADQFIQPRFSFLTNSITHRIIAALCIILAIPIAVIGFIPYLPALFAFPILFFALGMCVRDGFFTLSGIVLASVAILIIPWLMQFVF